MRSVMWLVIATVIGFIMIHGVGFYISKVATSGDNLFEKKLPSEYERVQAAAEYSPLISKHCTQMNWSSQKSKMDKKKLSP